ncbi:nucleotidyltransferase substrate binding protein [Marinobacter sp.]|uniref:nucleotidyltransferase substrate binding protein n=1 Tax=Marinobacter sp. TaxID=50741 RepID=UPI00384F2CDD
MTNRDVGWHQDFQNYRKASGQLDEAVLLMTERELSRLEKQGVIHAFEYTWELAWNTLSDYLKWQGVAQLTGSRDTIREAFSAGLIGDGQQWMNMLQDRNRTSHTYNEETAEAILNNIKGHYHGLFVDLKKVMTEQAERHELG